MGRQDSDDGRKEAAARPGQSRDGAAVLEEDVFAKQERLFAALPEESQPME
jgi:hypothetical protein